MFSFMFLFRQNIFCCPDSRCPYPDSPITQSFTLLNVWVRWVSLLSYSDHVEFPIHLNLWGRQVSLMTLGLLACWVSLSWMSECAEFYSPESLSTLSSLISLSDHVKFHIHLNLWGGQVYLMTLGMLSFTLLNVWVRRILLSWISEIAKFLSWHFSCWVSLSWMPEHWKGRWYQVLLN